MAYQKQNFEDGDILYANQLNHIEDGIVANEPPPPLTNEEIIELTNNIINNLKNN